MSLAEARELLRVFFFYDVWWLERFNLSPLSTQEVCGMQTPGHDDVRQLALGLCTVSFHTRWTFYLLFL
jgi:hypothetical protein